MGIVEIVLFSIAGLFFYIAPMILTLWSGYYLRSIRDSLSHGEIWFMALMPFMNIAAPSAFAFVINSERRK